MSDRLKSVESYMTNLDRTIAHPKIIQVNHEKVVEKKVLEPVIVQSGNRSSSNQRDEAFYLMMIEKMEVELRNAQKKSNYSIEDQEFKRIFFSGATREDDAKIK